MYIHLPLAALAIGEISSCLGGCNHLHTSRLRWQPPAELRASVLSDSSLFLRCGLASCMNSGDRCTSWQAKRRSVLGTFASWTLLSRSLVTDNSTGPGVLGNQQYAGCCRPHCHVVHVASRSKHTAAAQSYSASSSILGALLRGSRRPVPLLLVCLVLLA